MKCIFSLSLFVKSEIKFKKFLFIREINNKVNPKILDKMNFSYNQNSIVI
jgi:hypothetical protein